ncbi:MAG: CDP-alcohol phosphatidyltransferase family protein [Acidimicrobiales bacterium]
MTRGGAYAPQRTYPIAGLASPANIVTFSRIMVSPVLFWLILEAEDTLGTSWAAFLLGFVMGMSDLFDGRIARAHGPTKSGAFLDPLADKVVVIGAAVSLVAVDRYHWVPVAIIIVRELWVSAIRVQFARQGLSIPARRLAKGKTFIQGVALMLAVLPPLENHQTVIDVALWIAVAITVVSGWQYVRDGAAAAS